MYANRSGRYIYSLEGDVHLPSVSEPTGPNPNLGLLDIPSVVSEFFSDITLPSALSPWGRLNL